MGILDSITGNGLLSAGASILGGFLQSQGTQDTNSANAANIQQQEQFQQQMADTTYQRTVADMSAAGLNPMLAYQMQDPSPTGGSATFSNPWSGAIGSAQDAAAGIVDANTASQKQREAEPMAKLGDMADSGMKAVTDSISRLSDNLSGAMSKLGDVLDSVRSSAKQAHDDPQGTASDVARNLGDGNSLGDVQHFVSKQVTSALDARDSVAKSVDKARAVIANPESASSMPSARAQAKASGRRLGTLGRQPRYAPEYDGTD